MKTRYFDLAKKLSTKSDHHTHKLGCVIARGNRVAGIGFNKLKTTPKSNHPYKSIHAELDAIMNTNPTHLVGADLYIYRETKSGELATAKPCQYCQQLIKMIGIRRVFYTSKNGYEAIEL